MDTDIIEESQEKELKIAFLCKSVNPYWTDVELGARSVADKVGARLIFERPIRESAEKAIRRMEELADSGISGIAISTSFTELLAPVIRKTVNRGVPVVAMDTEVPGSGRLLYIGTNNSIAGRVAGDTLAKAVRFRGQVVICTGSVTALNAVDRMNSFRQAIARYPNISIVSVEDDGENAMRAFILAKGCLTKYPELTGFFGVFSSNGPAAARAIKMSGRTGVQVVCFDVLKDTVDMIREGDIYATIGQRPFTIGARTVETFSQIQHHGVDHVVRGAAGGIIDTGIDTVTRDSLERYTKFLERMGMPVRF